MKKTFKYLHTVGSCILTAALVCHIVLLSILPEPSFQSEFETLRYAIFTVSRYILIPSFTLVLLSGLFSMAFNDAFHNMGWVWVKAGLGLLMFEWILIGVAGPAQKAYLLIEESNFDIEMHNQFIKQEWGSIWVMLGLVSINILIAIWRPKFSSYKETSKIEEKAE